jgi:chromosomal replication initiation ATPase DnaA
VDQRFLGDEGFIEEADRKTSATREVTVRPLRIAFGALLTAVATTYGVAPKAILAPGRQRALVPARALFVHLARVWSGLTTRELGRRLQRDPSMISRLVATNVAHRDPATEARIRQSLTARTPK